MEDQQIIELYWCRSETAISETSVKYGRYLSGISINILKIYEEAEECVNDTYLRAWNSIPPARPSAFRSWLSKIIRNLSIDKYKMMHSKKRGGGEMDLLLSELENFIPSYDTPEVTLEDEEIAALISMFLREQSQESRVFFMRRYYYGESVRQIAERFEVSEGKIKSSLFRSRNALRKYLEKEGIVV